MDIDDVAHGQADTFRLHISIAIRSDRTQVPKQVP